MMLITMEYTLYGQFLFLFFCVFNECLADEDGPGATFTISTAGAFAAAATAAGCA